MTFNLRQSDNSGTPGGNRPSTRNKAKTRKAQSILRAYAHAPVGLGAQAVAAALWAMRPLPSPREAIRLTDGLPALTQSQALARFSAYLEALEAGQVKQEAAQAARPFKTLAALITPDRPMHPGEDRLDFLRRRAAGIIAKSKRGMEGEDPEESPNLDSLSGEGRGE